MHFNTLIVCSLIALTSANNSNVNAADETYTAAVVEYHPFVWRFDEELAVQINLKRYLTYIEAYKSPAVDIIVFPEATLNKPRTPREIPAPEENIIPCGNTTYDSVIQALSCGAKNSGIYVVINLYMKRNCTLEKMANTNDTRPCSLDNWSLYNTNVVFDRNGQVISVYRKFNLFIEYELTDTLTPDATSFKTDFGVEFGHIICFDILFMRPAYDLMNMGVKNFIFTTMWYPELPFLTSGQIQTYWAYTHNVNLLSAGGNIPALSHTGSGIYSGRKGTIANIMTSNDTTTVLVAKVPKDPMMNYQITQKNVTNYKNYNIRMFREKLGKYTTRKIEVTENEETFKLCSADLCCTFNLHLTEVDTFTKEEVGSDSYEYIAAVYAGERKFLYQTRDSVLNCALIACINSSYIRTCGTVFKHDNVVEKLKFKKINITGIFPVNETFSMPTTLTQDIMPLDVASFEYDDNQTFLKNNIMYKTININLVSTVESVYTFGIFSRSFLPSSAGGIFTNYSLTLLMAICIFFEQMFRKYGF